MDKIKMSEIRAKFPMYGDVSDQQLLSAVRSRYYSDIPFNQFVDSVDFDTERERLQKQMIDGMSTGERFMAGMGKSLSDVGRFGKRVANMVGIGNYDQAAAARDAELDKPLLDTTAGKVGKFAGDVALTALPGYRAAQGVTRGVQAAGAMLPRASAAINVAAPFVGATAAGAGTGAILSPEDISAGAGTGALAGMAGEVGGRVLSAAYGGAKAAVEPLTQAGRERVLKRTLERFSSDPTKVRQLAQNPVEFVPGYTPTLAEATMDPGIAQLQRGAAATSNDVASALADARGRQVAAYRSALDDLAGNDGRREFFDAARKTTADQLYGRARAEGLQMTPELEARAAQLLQRPSIQSAMKQARSLAKEKGIDISNAGGSVQGLQYVKEVLDDRIGSAVRAGNDKTAAALRDTQEQLLSFLDDASPAFGEARRTFQQMSRPINQMDVGQALRDTALPAITDINPSMARVNANAYANALRNSDQVARRATGLRSATMESVMDPAQMQTVQNIGKDMSRYAQAQELARVPGSPTAQYLGAQNVLRQFMGPLGLPQSAADSMLGRVAAGLLNLPFKMTQSQTEQLLGRALTDPQTAAKIMQAKDPRTIAELLRPYAAQAAIQLDTQ